MTMGAANRSPTLETLLRAGHDLSTWYSRCQTFGATLLTKDLIGRVKCTSHVFAHRHPRVANTSVAAARAFRYNV
jgi:hypothetical protein